MRTVIHACVPESFDRFYQEVGRGGRDGNASLSFVVYTDDDLDQAKNMAIDPLITESRGLERWECMWRDITNHSGNGPVCVSLSSKPLKVVQDSEANDAWNMRTLVLMARAGLLKFDVISPPQSLTEGNSTEDLKAWSEYFSSVAVRVNPGHMNSEVWEKVGGYRVRQRSFEEESINLMESLLVGEIRMTEAVSKAYELENIGLPVTVPGTCPRDRRDGLSIQTPDFSAPRISMAVSQKIEPRLLSALGSPTGLVFAPHEDGDWASREASEQRILDFLRISVSLGIRKIVTTRKWQDIPDFGKLYQRAPEKFIVHQLIEEIPPINLPGSDGLPLPRVSIIDNDVPPSILRNLLKVTEPLHVLIASQDTPHPDHHFQDCTL